MDPLDARQVKEAVKFESCPTCDAGSRLSGCLDVIKVNANLMYSMCNFCNSAFKFKRRKLRHYKDSCGWEYIIKYKNGELVGVRGYSIGIETFRDVYNQYIAIKKYFDSGFNEIDDLFKVMLNDHEESIFKVISSAFSDKEYYKNKKVLQNWHPKGQDELDEEDLLRKFHGELFF